MFHSRSVKPMQDILDGLEKVEPRERMGVWLKPAQTPQLISGNGTIWITNGTTNVTSAAWSGLANQFTLGGTVA